MSNHISPEKAAGSQQRVMQAFQEMRAKLDARERERSEPLAIIGMACRFPGGADSPEAFWDLLRAGQDAIVTTPGDRWDAQALYDPDPEHLGTMTTCEGGFLKGPVDQFDAHFFGVSPREAQNMDPQQRMLLEVTWEALERAGQPAAALEGGPTGVFIGSFNNDYLRHQIAQHACEQLYGLLGTLPSSAAGRVSYLLGLQGPTMQIDTACSSSLVAIDLACTSLRSGNCRMAIAGGVSLMLIPEPSIYLSRMRVLSPDGRCKAFDGRADGFGRGEGCGVVILKRLSDAQADGDTILALIRGSAVNHDGRSNGFTAPHGQAQESLIRAALQNAGVSPAQVQYVEAHGTGTILGDPIELQALASAYGPGHDIQHPLLVGSVKTNIGHLEPASGIAGLIKVILALQNSLIPPHLHLEQPNPYIPWGDLPIQIPTQQIAWAPGEAPRRAGISSFGLTGTNAHIIVEEAPAAVVRQPPLAAAPKAVIIPLSTRSPSALPALIERYDSWLGDLPADALPAVGYSAATRRSHHEYRIALVGRTIPEVRSGCAAATAQPDLLAAHLARRGLAQHTKLVYVFPGQGSQWFGMGKDLFESQPVFRDAIERCDQAMRPYIDWSLCDLVQGHAAPDLLQHIDVVQPALFAIEVGLATLWQSWHIPPDAVVGHSMGEVAACYIAGVLSLDDAARVICLRSQLMRTICGQGAMALIEVAEEEAKRLLGSYAGQLAIAVINSRRSTVVAGDPQALSALLEDLDRRAIFCRKIKVDVASHSPQVDSICAELIPLLSSIQPQQGTLPVYSTATAAILQGDRAGAAYWAQNLRQPVQFAHTIEQLKADGHAIFIEVSPHPLLLSSIGEAFTTADECLLVPSLRRDTQADDTLLLGIGDLYAAGYDIQWQHVVAPQPTLGLPTYPWQQEPFWLEEGTAKPSRANANLHPLLGQHTACADQAGRDLWQTSIHLADIPYLADHQVQGGCIFPAAAYIEQMLAAMDALDPIGKDRQLADVQISAALALEPPPALQIVAHSSAAGTAKIQIFSHALPENAQLHTSDAWLLHASGVCRPLVRDAEAPQVADLSLMHNAEAQRLEADAFYALTQRARMSYGPAFRGIATVWYTKRSSQAKLILPPRAQLAQYILHPALLDAALQAVLAPLLHGDPDAAYLPIRIDQIRLTARLADVDTKEPLWSVADIRPQDTGSDTRIADIALADQHGQIVVAIHGLQIRRLATHHAQRDISWLYHTQWRHVELAASESCDRRPHLIIRWPGETASMGETIVGALEAAGDTCLQVILGGEASSGGAGTLRVDTPSAEAWLTLLRSQRHIDQRSAAPLGNVVWIWNDAAADPASTYGHEQQLCWMLSLVQAIGKLAWRRLPRLWAITQGALHGAQLHGAVRLDHTALCGMLRTIACEQPQLHCTQIDIESDNPPSALQVAERILAGDPEDIVALRNAQWYAARLARGTAAESSEQTFDAAEGQPYTLDIDRPGAIERLVWRAVRRPIPAPDEVEIEVEAAGLNFLDVLKTLGEYPGQDTGAPLLGNECAGRVVSVGQHVAGLAPGTRVLAIVAQAPGAFGRYVTTPACLAHPIPEGMDSVSAAALPLAFVTCWYALIHTAHLAQGERILIHTASGGTGLAAIQIAQLRGAEIIATAGSPEKRAYLRSLGIAHVFDSRTLDFAEQVRGITDGHGVDVVLNTLTGAAAAQSLSLLAPFGRFVELSKKDIYTHGTLDLDLFRKNLTYTTVDIAAMLRERPTLVGQLLRDAMAALDQGQLTALPVQPFLAEHVHAAFTLMAQGRHQGKIVINMAARSQLRLAPMRQVSRPIRGDVGYVITGGVGGIGLQLAAWLVGQGARRLVLTARSAPSPAAGQAIDTLRQRGATVDVWQADVANYDAMASHIEAYRTSAGRIGGIFHLAGILDDAMLDQLTPAQISAVLRPKIQGAWNLHRLGEDQSLEHFVLFSSAASLLGSPGQSHYAAANAFLDALAVWRSQRGLAARSISWGAWADIGLAAAQENRGGRLAYQGLPSMPPSQALALFEQVLCSPQQSTPHIGLMSFHLRQWVQSHAYAARSPLLRDLLDADAPHDAKAAPMPLRNQLLAAPFAQRCSLIEAHLCTLVRRILRLASTSIDPAASLKALGFDSLMAVELRNLLEDSLGLVLSVTLIWQHPSIGQLSAYLAQQLQAPLPEKEVAISPDSREGDLDGIQQLEGDELHTLLEAELSSLEAELQQDEKWT